MKILVNGAAGRMGQALRSMIERGSYGAALAGMADAYAQVPGMLQSLAAFTGESDCIVDFSNHAATETLVDCAAGWKMPLVIATTGQTEEEMNLIRQAAEQVPVFYSGNMSLGIAVLTELTKTVVRTFPNADVEIVESHHNQKLDVPSGTALMLGKAVQAVRPGARLVVGRNHDGMRTPDEVGIHSLRLGTTVGIHEVIVHTGSQVLTLRHEAQDRALFAEGALAAAAFLVGRTPGLYDMSDLVTQP